MFSFGWKACVCEWIYVSGVTRNSQNVIFTTENETLILLNVWGMVIRKKYAKCLNKGSQNHIQIHTQTHIYLCAGARTRVLVCVCVLVCPSASECVGVSSIMNELINMPAWAHTDTYICILAR